MLQYSRMKAICLELVKIWFSGILDKEKLSSKLCKEWGVRQQRGFMMVTCMVSLAGRQVLNMILHVQEKSIPWGMNNRSKSTERALGTSITKVSFPSSDN